MQEPEGGLYIAESTKVIARALAAGHRPRSVLLQEQWLPDMEPLLAGFPDVPVFVGEPKLLEQLTGYNLHRGALAAMHRPPLAPVDEIIDGRAPRRHAGRHRGPHQRRRDLPLGRPASARMPCSITPRCADPLYRRSVRVSMGTVLQVPWTRLPEWEDAAPILHGAGFHVAALALADDAVSLDDFAPARHERLAIVLGAEGDGLSRQALASGGHGGAPSRCCTASTRSTWPPRARSPSARCGPDRPVPPRGGAASVQSPLGRIDGCRCPARR